MDFIITRCGDPNELMHYGVKGMKWGVRRASELASKAYRGISDHGTNALEKKAKKYDYMSKEHKKNWA